MKKRKRIVIILATIIVVAVGVRLFNNMDFEYRQPEEQGNTCVAYYLLNIDGMKGLGHSSFMLVNERGEGRFYSYNGMQYSLLQCLMGKAGIGKMKQFNLSAEEVTIFLSTGDLQVSDVSECDNFDRALYRYISEEEYETIVKEAESYIQVGEEYEALYAEIHSSTGDALVDAQGRMEVFLAQEDLPLYQIYQHNCDTVARELIALIDEEAKTFNGSEECLTPSGNYKRMCKYFGEEWGCGSLGADTVVEIILWYL